MKQLHVTGTKRKLALKSKSMCTDLIERAAHAERVAVGPGVHSSGGEWGSVDAFAVVLRVRPVIGATAKGVPEENTFNR